MKIAVMLILAVCVSLFALSLFVLVRGMRMIEESRNREQDLEVVRKGLHKKELSLDLWESQLRTSAIDIASSRKIWANYVLDVGVEENERAIYKSLASKLGYATMKFYSDRIRVTEKEDGRKVFSVEVNVSPFNEKKS